MMASEAQPLDTPPSQNERLQFVTRKWDLATFGWSGLPTWTQVNRKLFCQRWCSFGYLSVSVNAALTYNQLQGDNDG